jgi:hypothetical protein
MEERFVSNLERVRSIVQMYDVVAGAGQGRPTVQEGDLLRVAIVFLHATLEELLRDLAQERLWLAPPEVLRQLPWPRGGGSTKTTFDLGDLAAFRGQTVHEVIQYAVESHLERSNFNHPGDVKQILNWVGIDPSLVDPYVRELGAMMSRRHWIVHRGDRNPAVGRGHHSVRSVSKSTVAKWTKAVERCGSNILAAITST